MHVQVTQNASRGISSAMDFHVADTGDTILSLVRSLGQKIRIDDHILSAMQTSAGLIVRTPSAHRLVTANPALHNPRASIAEHMRNLLNAGYRSASVPLGLLLARQRFARNQRDSEPLLVLCHEPINVRFRDQVRTYYLGLNPKKGGYVGAVRGDSTLKESMRILLSPKAH